MRVPDELAVGAAIERLVRGLLSKLESVANALHSRGFKVWADFVVEAVSRWNQGNGRYGSCHGAVKSSSLLIEGMWPGTWVEYLDFLRLETIQKIGEK